MSLTTSGRMWDDASSPEVTLLGERFEADWRVSSGVRPDPRGYLPDDPERRSAVLLALLRLDLALRWKSRDRVPVEWYRDRYPELDGDALVALLYEEFCLREEAGEAPEASDYEERFPEVVVSFREVLEIHGLIGHVRSPAPRAGPGQPATPFPEVGQTIAGFRLVEDLGRGAFARVYRAEERQLADRPVALKVTRTPSREPQTLARLQHTHIVPVYSYRTDPATGLHLLCMPYLGRITLAQILAHPEIRTARSGADLLALVDRLQAFGDAADERPASREAFARRTYAQAIAWWGARMAESLQHAHDHGVLHRDVKPSNVLVSGDGMPMLLDFNLAQESWVDQPDAAPAALGGTLAYMAPEQLEALAEGMLDRVDTRADVYALGVVLYDCLVRGTRTFALPSGSATVTEALLRAAEARRAGVPRLRDRHRDVPAALEAVVRRCLAPEPDDRYASAEELAADLQAVADDGPLRHASEPLPSRSIRWLRRHRQRLAVIVPLVVALGVSASLLVGAELAALRRESEVKNSINEGRHAFKDGQFDLAAFQFATAARLASSDERLRSLLDVARKEGDRARRTKEIRDKADDLFTMGESLRSSLLGFGGNKSTASLDVRSALLPFSVLDDPNWMRRRSIALLDDIRRERLFREVNDLLFLWVVTLDRGRPGNPEMARQALRICGVALTFAAPAGPWQALRERYQELLAGNPPLLRTFDPPPGENSAHGCFQWALLCDLADRKDATIAWLEQANRLDPRDYWSQFYSGFYHEQSGHHQRALEHYHVAVALRERSPWARFNRARIYRIRGSWERALEDLNQAMALSQGIDFPELLLELGLAKQNLGDIAGARAAYESVIRSQAGGPLARAGRLNGAKLDNDEGAVDRARAEYDALLDDDPRDSEARLSRALLALRHGRPARAEADLTVLLGEIPERADEIYARRALARLALGRADDAEDDAANAFRRRPSPSRERLWIRTLIAQGRVEELLWLNDPDDVAELPGGGRSWRTDLRAATVKLGAESEAGRIAPALAARTRAVLESSMGRPQAAAEANRAVALAPQSADSYLVRARVRRRLRDTEGALSDVESALAIAPGDPRLLELRGTLKTESGNSQAALIDLNRAAVRGARGTIRAAKARTLLALGRSEAATEEWSLALEDDPEDPLAYLGRAQALIRLARWDRALVDLDQAAIWAVDNPGLLARIMVSYARCLLARPGRASRWIALARRSWSAAVRARDGYSQVRDAR
jgi:serine/threonine protein kinase/Tfp pilus assembly protein PilF